MLFSLLLIRAAANNRNNELSIEIEMLAEEIKELSRTVDELKKLFYVQNSLFVSRFVKKPVQVPIFRNITFDNKNKYRNDGRVSGFLHKTPKILFKTKTNDWSFAGPVQFSARSRSVGHSKAHSRNSTIWIYR